MVVCSDFSGIASEEFALEYELSVPETENIIVGVRNERMGQPKIDLGARETLRVSAEVLGANDRRQLLHYNAEDGISIGDDPPQPHTHFPGPEDRGFLLAFLARLPSFSRHFFSSLIAANSAQRFDESLDLFRRIVSTAEPIANLADLGDDAPIVRYSESRK